MPKMGTSYYARLLVVAPLQTHFVNTAGQGEIHADERTMKAAMRSKLLRLLVTVFSHKHLSSGRVSAMIQLLG